jgi:hypothetical protein
VFFGTAVSAEDSVSAAAEAGVLGCVEPVGDGVPPADATLVPEKLFPGIPITMANATRNVPTAPNARPLPTQPAPVACPLILTLL